MQEVLAELRDIHTASYSYEVLKKKPLPEGINTLCLESYLDDAEFEVRRSVSYYKLVIFHFNFLLFAESFWF